MPSERTRYLVGFMTKTRCLWLPPLKVVDTDATLSIRILWRALIEEYVGFPCILGMTCCENCLVSSKTDGATMVGVVF
eukprot:9286661-Ditylum_brightwellii.AAC.1